jgi:cytidylate kinase-like protein
MNYQELSLPVTQALLRAHGGVVGRGAASPSAEAARPRPAFCITISREAGALGHTVATEVGKRLAWPVYDREILDKIAEEIRRPLRHLEAVDERAGHWLEEALSALLNEYHISSDTYLRYLIGTVWGLGEVGRCVLVGRGANFILPAATTLRARLVASLAFRVRVLARRLGVSEKEALVWAETTERQRYAFVKRYFSQDPTDPHHYDLVLNMARLSADEAAGVIVQTLRGFEEHSSPGKRQPESAAV